MPDGDNIHSVDRVAGGSRGMPTQSSRTVARKISCCGSRDSRRRRSVAAQTGEARQRAESFLSLAEDSDLAVAPEWSYNVEWVFEHDELFFEESPLFVLGCRPVEIQYFTKPLS